MLRDWLKFQGTIYMPEDLHGAGLRKQMERLNPWLPYTNILEAYPSPPPDYLGHCVHTLGSFSISL